MISTVLIYIGLSLMLASTTLSLFEKNFMKRLHYLSSSDVSGALIVMIGITLGGFGVSRVILSMIFLSIWSPVITHMISKAYIKRLKR